VSEASSIVASFVVISSSSSVVGVGCFGRFGDGRVVVVVVDVVVNVPTETPSLLWNSLPLLIVDEGLTTNGSAVSVSVLNSKATRVKQLRLLLCR
jgi:hypothetical protein